MCKLCKRLICPRECPNFEEEERRGPIVICVLCGERIDFGTRYYEMHGFPYCACCLLRSDGDALVRICEKESQFIFEKMGFSVKTVGEGM